MPALKRLSIPDPASFHALLMPSLYGAEAFYLVEQGVPASNLFAVEDNCAETNYDKFFDVHAEIKACQFADRQELKGMRTTDRPKAFSEALDEAYYAFDEKKYNLIYLDFLSQPEYKVHYDNGLLKIMRARMLAPNGTLILTFGRSRCRSNTAGLNHDLLKASRRLLKIGQNLPTEVYVGAAVAKTKHPLFKRMRSYSYESKPDNGKRGKIEYVTTVVEF